MSKQQNSIDTSLGKISIDNEAIAGYAGGAAVECMGIVGMAAVSMKDGWGTLLKKESLTRGIIVNRKGNHVSLDMHVIAAYGSNILAIGSNLMENVTYAIEEHTGLTVDDIRVFVDGVRVID